MDAANNKRMENLNASIKSDFRSVTTRVDKVIGRLENRVNSVGEGLQDLRKKVEEDSRAVEDRLSRLERGGSLKQCTREEQNYWNARASLRICLVKGPNLREGVAEFLEKVLLLGKSTGEKYKETTRKTWEQI
jgi:hypothetical protein